MPRCGTPRSRQAGRRSGDEAPSAGRSRRCRYPSCLRRREPSIFHLAASLLDGRTRALGHLDALERDGLRDLAGGDDLDLLRLLTDHVGGLQRQQIDDFGANALQLMQADFLGERRGARRESDLRQTALQRHLAAFETDLVVAAGTRLLALVALARSLAQAGTDAAAEPLLLRLAALGGLQRIQLHVRLPRPSADRTPC